MGNLIVTECVNSFLCHQNCVTYGAFLSFGQSCFSTGSCYCCIDNFGVSFSRNNFLRYGDLATLGAFLSFCKTGFGAGCILAIEGFGVGVRTFNLGVFVVNGYDAFCFVSAFLGSYCNDCSTFANCLNETVGIDFCHTIVAGTPHYISNCRCFRCKGCCKSLATTDSHIKSSLIQGYARNARDRAVIDAFKVLLSACHIKNAGIGFFSTEFHNCIHNSIY